MQQGRGYALEHFLLAKRHEQGLPGPLGGVPAHVPLAADEDVAPNLAHLPGEQAKGSHGHQEEKDVFQHASKDKSWAVWAGNLVGMPSIFRFGGVQPSNFLTIGVAPLGLIRTFAVPKR